VLWLDPPHGATELPTCPVCLERLDEHISGIVTTVRRRVTLLCSVCWIVGYLCAAAQPTTAAACVSDKDTQEACWCNALPFLQCAVVYGAMSGHT
jgi:hypothetical protein